MNEEMVKMHVYLPVPLMDAVKRVAKQEDRSVSRQITFLLRNALFPTPQPTEEDNDE